MPLHQLPTFLLAVTLVELTPGPNMTYLVVVAARDGRRAGWATILGVTAALGFWLLATAAGVAEAFRTFPWVFPVLRWGGVAYLLWLAFDIATSRPQPSPIGRPLLHDGMRHAARGFVANILNPKAAIFYLVFLPTFLDPRSDLIAQVLSLGAIHLAVSVLVHGSIVASVGHARRQASQALRRRETRWAFALALMATALWLAHAAPSGVAPK